jgi:hypothetical protein
MTRLYIQPSWIDSCSDHGEWSGGNDQYRGDKSIEAVPTYINGKPNVKAFSDEAIEARKEKRKTSVPLKSRILPQLSRVEKLRSEILELETAYRAGEFSLEEYSVYRDVAFAKLQRAEFLYKKAIAAKPIKTEEEYEEDTQQVEAETAYSSCDVDYSHTEVATPCGVSWMSDFIDELPRTNSFKKILQIACKTTKALIRYTQATKQYIKTLSEV